RTARGAAALGTAAAASVSGPNATIGGTGASPRTVTSGNNGNGVQLSGDNTLVAGNYIGVATAGTTALGNQGFGVAVISGSHNVIGGTTAAARNVISGNSLGGAVGALGRPDFTPLRGK